MIAETLDLARSVVRFQGFVVVRTSAGQEQVSAPRTFRRGQFAEMATHLDWAVSEGLEVLIGIPGLDGGATDGR